MTDILAAECLNRVFGGLQGECVAKNYYDITLALAGVCQAARLVQELAHQGHCDSDALHVSLNSIIDLDPDSPSSFGA